jgi:hypothetical protein
MAELSPRHIHTLERFVSAGFAIAAFPMYASAVGVRKGNCAALLDPLADGTLCLVGLPSHLVEGNLGVRIHDANGDWFVWKSKRIEATPERLAELAGMTEEIRTLLAPV